MEGSFVVYVPKSVRRDLLKIPLPWRMRMVKAIDSLATNPWAGEKMLGKMAARRKLRVWPYRLLYRIEEK